MVQSVERDRPESWRAAGRAAATGPGWCDRHGRKRSTAQIGRNIQRAMALPVPFRAIPMAGLRGAAFRAAVALACCLALVAPATTWAADPNKVLRIAFEIEETGFDPAKVTDIYSSDVI